MSTDMKFDSLYKVGMRVLTQLTVQSQIMQVEHMNCFGATFIYANS